MFRQGHSRTTPATVSSYPSPQQEGGMSHNSAIEKMLDTIRRECDFTCGLTGIYTFPQNIMDAMAEVIREDFVPDDLKAYAYNNSPLPIGFGQTISQPYIVALMTTLLIPNESSVILEVGAGSGYQAAVLAKLVKKVYTIEIVPELAALAEKRLARLGYDNVEVSQGDGHKGLSRHAPYDGIIVTAAASNVPAPLKEQLKPGGRLVIPVGLPHSTQHLMLIDKDHRGTFFTKDILPVAFVPLTGGDRG